MPLRPLAPRPARRGSEEEGAPSITGVEAIPHF